MARDEARHVSGKWPYGIVGALSAFVIEILIVVAMVGLALGLAATALAVF
jgi:hypothetical protein